MDTKVQKILEQIRDLSIQIFENNLAGIYVHGSLALGCFNWNKSDIDFIVVLKNPPAQKQKERYIAGLLDINKNGPSKGLEMSIVLEKYTQQFVYPTPFELHFSNTHLKQCSDDPEAYCRNMNGTDKDLAAHFTIINNACLVLYGKAVRDTFGEVPKADYFDSIKADIENAEEEIMENPTYIILNLCRVLAFRCDDRILSKKDGGIWGIEHIDKRYSGIIEKAVSAYQSIDSFHWEEDEDTLIAFAKYAINLIFPKCKRIREAREEDLDGILDLYLYLHEKSIPEQSEHLIYTWESIINDVNHHLIVCEVNGKLVASCVCVIIPNLTRNARPYAFVENVVTHMDYRKKGYATDCLNYAKHIAEESNCYKMMLLTGSKEESTLNFYRNAGYNSTDKTAFIQWIGLEVSQAGMGCTVDKLSEVM